MPKTNLPQPMPAYFLVKIPKEQQKERKEKIGSIYLAPGFVWMTRELQCGEIVSIGERASYEFPEAKEGDILLIHHFATGKKDEKNNELFLVDEDESYKYYVVTALDWNGQRNMSYGVWNGEEIITHPEYILLETEPLKEAKSAEEYLNENTSKTTSGLLVFKEWNEDRSSKEAKMKELQNQVTELSKTAMNDEVRRGIERKEKEMNDISKQLNAKRYLPYKIAAFNPILHKHFETKVKKGDVMYMLNIACQTKIEFMNKEYIIAKSDYIGMLYNKEFTEKEVLAYAD